MPATCRHFDIAANKIEIVVSIEGTESVTSNTLQARYSYTGDDILYNMAFAPCVRIGDDGQAVIDFNHFHDLVALDESHNYHDDIFIQTIN